MYFTPEGLEQATRLSVATHRAARARASGASTLIDLGCGIGGDLVAFARAGMTCAGVDLDPVRVAVAMANLDALGLGGAVTTADATSVDTSPFDLAYADPARRSAKGRSFDVDEWTPPWPFVSNAVRARLLRQARARHPPPTRARGGGGRVGQRPPRGQGGRALVGAAGDGPASGHGDRRRRPRHPDRRGRSGSHHGRCRGVLLRAGRRRDPGRTGDRGRRRGPRAICWTSTSPT